MEGFTFPTGAQATARGKDELLPKLRVFYSQVPWEIPSPTTAQVANVTADGLM